MDQHIGSYSTNTKFRKWTMAVFSYMLDIARINSQTLFAFNHNTNPRQTSSVKFGWRIGNAFVTPHLQAKNNSASVRISVRKKKSRLKIITEDDGDVTDVDNGNAESAHPYEKFVQKRERCKSRLDSIYG